VSWQQEYHRRFYDRSRGWKDGTREFHDLCREILPGGGRILEIGPGPSNPTSRFLSGLGDLHGLDPDPAVRGNDALLSATLLESERFPFDDLSFGACVSNFVLEHVADPVRHLLEVRRVLKPGAPYVFRTPNRFHYVALAASVTPYRFHVGVANRLRNLPEESHDPYPTFYRCNSRRSLRRQALAAGLRVDRFKLIEKEPSYGMSSRALFLAFVAYERLVNSSEALSGLRSVILGVLRRPASG
jgi:SAM-dependent methyltransferase